MDESIKLKTSRRSFVVKYVIGIILLLVFFFFDLSVWIDYPILALIVYLLMESEFLVFYRTYFIDSEKITQEEGFIAKRRMTIPCSSISNIVMRKGLIGRIFRFGDLIITSFAGGENRITLKGIKHPEKIFEIIEDSIKLYSR